MKNTTKCYENDYIKCVFVIWNCCDRLEELTNKLNIVYSFILKVQITYLYICNLLFLFRTTISHM